MTQDTRWVRGTYPGSRIQSQPENKALSVVLKLPHLMKKEDMEKEAELLEEALEKIDPSVVRAHSCGVGNALHQAMSWMLTHSPGSISRSYPILRVLMERGSMSHVKTGRRDVSGGSMRA